METGFQDAIEILMADPGSRQALLRKLNELLPGNPAVELAAKYHADPDFRLWLEEHTWKALQEERI